MKREDEISSSSSSSLNTASLHNIKNFPPFEEEEVKEEVKEEESRE